ARLLQRARRKSTQARMPAPRCLSFGRHLLFGSRPKWQHIRRHANAARELEWILARARKGYLNKVSCESFRWLRNFADIYAAALIFERRTRIGLTQRDQAEVPRLGIGRLPEFHFEGFCRRLHADRSVLLKLP